MIISDLNHLEIVNQANEITGATGAQIVGDISAYIQKALEQKSTATSSIVTNNNSYSPSTATSSNTLSVVTDLKLSF